MDDNVVCRSVVRPERSQSPILTAIVLLQPEGIIPFRFIFSAEVNNVRYGNAAQQEGVPASRWVWKFCGRCRAVESFHRDDQQAPDVSREAFGVPPAKS